ncbi:MAG: glycosyltransferase [Tahibacter sp.]
MRAMHLGIRHTERRWLASSELRRLLFLCGYQHSTQRAIHDVLNERGLADLLDAGTTLAERGITLTIAIPFLRDQHMRERMRREIAARCPRLIVDLQGEISTNDLFASHDAFSFPYRNEHAVFVPTSLLEAISFGIPVVAADHVMYRDLTHSAVGPRCSLHRVGDPAHLASVVAGMQDSYGDSVVRANAAAIDVRGEWTLDNAVDELLGALMMSAE